MHWQLVTANICTVCKRKVSANFKSTSSVQSASQSVFTDMHEHNFVYWHQAGGSYGGGEKPDELPWRRTLGEPQLRQPSSSSTGPRPPPKCCEQIRRRVRETHRTTHTFTYRHAGWGWWLWWWGCWGTYTHTHSWGSAAEPVQKFTDAQATSKSGELSWGPQPVQQMIRMNGIWHMTHFPLSAFQHSWGQWHTWGLYCFVVKHEN